MNCTIIPKVWNAEDIIENFIRYHSKFVNKFIRL